MFKYLMKKVIKKSGLKISKNKKRVKRIIK